MEVGWAAWLALHPSEGGRQAAPPPEPPPAPFGGGIIGGLHHIRVGPTTEPSRGLTMISCDVPKVRSQERLLAFKESNFAWPS